MGDLVSLVKDLGVDLIFSSSSSPVSYLSYQSNNEMLRALSGYLEEMYLLEWRQSDFFTLLADEAADKSGSENLVVLAR